METYKDISINYYDVNGNKLIRCVVPITSDALVHYELMQSHYCKLSFKTATPVYIELGDFIETAFGRFEATSDVKPNEDDNLGYSYEVQFEAYYRKLKNKTLKYRPNSGSPEATFSLTSNINTHANIILDNFSYLSTLSKSYLYDPLYSGGEGTDYVVKVDDSVDAKAAKLVTYSNTNILDAIANIAQTFKCEWWFEGNILHFGICENTNAIVDFKLGGNIVSMSSSQSQSSYANRVYAFGAAKNLPSGYKKDDSADITKNGVVEKRLMLPTEKECSDANKALLSENGFELKNGFVQVKGLTEDQYVEGVTTNDDIYPRNLIKTSSVSFYEKDVEDESTPEEGDYIKRTFYKLGGLTIVNSDGEKIGDMAFRNSYKLSGMTLHVVFQSGSLNGMDFECEFNPDAASEILRDNNGNPILKNGKEQINPASQVFEIIANENYGRFLPDTSLHPKDGDTFVLYNWDSTKLGDTLVSAASNELLADSIKNLKKSMIDPTTYTCTVDSVYSFNEGNGHIHGVGDRVNLYNDGYASTYRSSRVIGYEVKLDVPFDGVKYYVGEKPSYSRLNAMESKIEELVYNGQSYINGGGGGNTIYIIKSYDKTTPTDYNVYSAKAVDEQRLRKDKDDTVKGTITFEKVQKFLEGLRVGENGELGIDAFGKAVLDILQSPDYDYATQNGFAFSKRRDGKYTLNITDLLVWGKAIFNNLEIRSLYSVGGNIVLSPSSSKLIKVEEYYEYDLSGNQVQTGWKCYILADDGTTSTTNQWQVDDQARCQTFNIDSGAYENVSNKSYWRKITEVSTENEQIADGNGHILYEGKKFAWVVLSKTDCMEGSDAPSDGDTIVCMGNRLDTDRQHLIMLETVGDDAPCIALYRGVHDYSLTGKDIFKASFSGVDIVSKYFRQRTMSGERVWTPLYRGTWKEDSEYSYYDEVSWMGTRWLCVVPEGQTSTDEPSEISDQWKATTNIYKPTLVLETDILQTGIAKGESHDITCRLMLGDKDVSSSVQTWNIKRRTSDSVDDAAWAMLDKAKNFKGFISIEWSDDESVDDLGNGDVAKFTFTATTTTGKIHEAFIEL